jgi:tetratricopeptide (TPR) repeat protein
MFGSCCKPSWAGCLEDCAVLDLTSLTVLAFPSLPPTTQMSAQAFFNQGVVKTFRGDYSGAIEDFSQALARNPNIIEAYCNRGLIRVGRGDYQTAIADFNEALQIDPNHADAYNKRGNAFAKLGDIPLLSLSEI